MNTINSTKTGIEMNEAEFKTRFYSGREIDRPVKVGDQVAMKAGEGYACYEVTALYDGLVHLKHVPLS